MAIFQTVNGNAKLPLLSFHTFGRRRDRVDYHVDSPQVSRIHAVVEWISGAWYLRDVCNGNGTYLNAEKLAPQVDTQLSVGDVIQFANCRESQMRVVDLGAPVSMLFPMNSGSPILPLDSFNFLPAEENPEAVLFFHEDKNCWCLDVALGGDMSQQPTSMEVVPGESFSLGKHAWRLLVQPTFARTLTLQKSSISLSAYQFLFDLSLNEEHANLKLLNQNVNRQIDLGERAHHYLLYYLATVRLQHLQAGYAEKDQGWIETDLLCRQLGMDVTHINILLFRARKQIAAALPDVPGVSLIIERRRGELRLNHGNIGITKGHNRLEIDSFSAIEC